MYEDILKKCVELEQLLNENSIAETGELAALKNICLAEMIMDGAPATELIREEEVHYLSVEYDGSEVKGLKEDIEKIIKNKKSLPKQQEKVPEQKMPEAPSFAAENAVKDADIENHTAAPGEEKPIQKAEEMKRDAPDTSKPQQVQDAGNMDDELQLEIPPVVQPEPEPAMQTPAQKEPEDNGLLNIPQAQEVPEPAIRPAAGAEPEDEELLLNIPQAQKTPEPVIQTPVPEEPEDDSCLLNIPTVNEQPQPTPVPAQVPAPAPAPMLQMPQMNAMTMEQMQMFMQAFMAMQQPQTAAPAQMPAQAPAQMPISTPAPAPAPVPAPRPKEVVPTAVPVQNAAPASAPKPTHMPDVSQVKSEPTPSIIGPDGGTVSKAKREFEYEKHEIIIKDTDGTEVSAYVMVYPLTKEQEGFAVPVMAAMTISGRTRANYIDKNGTVKLEFDDYAFNVIGKWNKGDFHSVVMKMSTNIESIKDSITHIRQLSPAKESFMQFFIGSTQIRVFPVYEMNNDDGISEAVVVKTEGEESEIIKADLSGRVDFTAGGRAYALETYWFGQDYICDVK